MVTPLLGADLLVMLTGVDGVLDRAGRRIPIFGGLDDVVDRGDATATHGSGGIVSKVEAARKACRSGAHAVVARATLEHVLTRIVAGQDVGTLFLPAGNALRARKHWIAYTLRPRGTVVLDDGAVQALKSGNKSLLPIGVLGVRGKFDPGDAVRLVGADGAEVARGLSRISALEVARAAGICRDATGNVEAEALPPVVVHKDDLVLIE
jgi:glutamate 5-kinase